MQRAARMNGPPQSEIKLLRRSTRLNMSFVQLLFDQQFRKLRYDFPGDSLDNLGRHQLNDSARNHLDHLKRNCGTCWRGNWRWNGYRIKEVDFHRRVRNYRRRV